MVNQTKNKNKEPNKCCKTPLSKANRRANARMNGQGKQQKSNSMVWSRCSEIRGDGGKGDGVRKYPVHCFPPLLTLLVEPTKKRGAQKGARH